MRDHTKLKAFELADTLTLDSYRTTASFPKEEQYGLTAQIRRAAVSVTSNIVEGCARRTEADYLHFLDMAYGSAHELGYQMSLAWRLGYMNDDTYKKINSSCEEVCRVLNGLIRSFRR